MDEPYRERGPGATSGLFHSICNFDEHPTVTVIECGLILIGVAIVTLLVLEIFGIRVLA
jgi:hypothetical protein